MAGDEEKKVGFEGIGKRIENLEEDISVKDTTNPQKKTEQPQQTKPESDIKQESTSKTASTMSTTKKGGSSFTFSFSKLFWGIIAIVILIFLFSQNNDKKKTYYSPSSNNTPVQRSVPPPALPSDEYVITDGKYRCGSYQHNMAQTLLPNLIEKQDIKRLQNFIESAGNELDQLKAQIEITSVDNYSQNSVDYYNMLVNDYNSKLETYKIKSNILQRKFDSYNIKITNYNNYLMANCKKAY